MRHFGYLAPALLLAGCTFGAPNAPASAPTGDSTALNLFKVNLELRLDALRTVQELPGFWSEATVSLVSNRLKAPLVQNVATSSTRLSVVFLAPPGPATVSVELGNGAVAVAKGLSPTTLVIGDNSVTIELSPLLDFWGRLDGQ